MVYLLFLKMTQYDAIIIISILITEQSLNKIQLKIQSIKSTDVSQGISFLEKWKFLLFNFDIYFYKQKHVEYLQFS